MVYLFWNVFTELIEQVDISRILILAGHSSILAATLWDLFCQVFGPFHLMELLDLVWRTGA